MMVWYRTRIVPSGVVLPPHPIEFAHPDHENDAGRSCMRCGFSMRDYVGFGIVEKLLLDHERHPPPYVYDDPNIENYIRSLAARLMGKR